MIFIHRRGAISICVVAIGLLFSGCAARLVGVLAADEIVLLRAAGIRTTTTGLVLESEGALATQIARTRIMRGAAGRQLYVMENGKKNVFANLVNSNTIKWTRSGHVQSLPGHLYTLRRGIGNANIRTGPGKHYPVYKTVGADELLIIMEENGGWLKVQLENEAVGWISAAIVLAASEDEEEKKVTKPVSKPAATRKVTLPSDNGFTWGSQPTSVFKNIDCPTCINGQAKCFKCSGEGTQSCSGCSGVGQWDCSNCNNGRIDCGQCDKGRLMCGSCNGYSYKLCSFCRGYGYVLDQYNRRHTCRSCNGYPQFDCEYCVTGYFNCSHCSGYGSFGCYNCSSVGTFTCSTCRGYRNQYCTECQGRKVGRCYDCLGHGTTSILVAARQNSAYCATWNTGTFDLYNSCYAGFYIKIYRYDNGWTSEIYSGTIPSKTVFSFFNKQVGRYLLEMYYGGSFHSSKYFNVTSCSDDVISIAGL